MTKQEAIQAMLEGKKVTHQYFTSDEWMTIERNLIVLEDGVRCSPQIFWGYREGKGWEDGYSLYKDTK